MNKLSQLLNLENDEALFNEIANSFKSSITQWDYFVDWKKVFSNISPIEKELNLLNYLVGKENIEEETCNLIKQYPQVIRAIPILIALRKKSVDILIDKRNFICENYSFTSKDISDKEARNLSKFVLKSGLANLLKDKKVKNLVDYAIGVEVGLDTNGRKNRGGTLMENLVEEFVAHACSESNLAYMPQATAKKIKEHWGIEIKVDKSRRIVDFAINRDGQLFFIETNFYGGGGSKLKSTATEYIKMNEFWNAQDIEFIWITDGAGWKSTLKPLREYFDKADYLLNLEMLKDGVLNKLLNH